MAETNQTYPLAGVKVLDLSRALSGPYAGRLLSDLGADVVKIEGPSGDMTRRLGEIRHGFSGLFTQLNAGKRNVGLDLHNSESAEVLRKLVRRADVLIENFRPGVLDRLNLGWSSLSAENPRLVMLSITGFGQDGPAADRRAFAPVIHAESGLLHRQADADGCGPHDLVLGLADSVAGLHGVVAVLAALRCRDRDGAGQHIDMAMLDALVATDDYAHHAADHHFPVWPVRGRVWDTPSGPIMIAADPKMLWYELSRHFGLEDDSPAGTVLDEKVARRERVMGEWIAAQPTRQALIAALDRAGLAWGDVRAPADVPDAPSLAARSMVAEIDDRGGGVRRIVQSPYRFSSAASGVRGSTAYLGEHNVGVLSEWLGLDLAGVGDLTDRGVLCSEPATAR